MLEAFHAIEPGLSASHGASLGLRGGVGCCQGGGDLHPCVASPLSGGCVADPFGDGFVSLRGDGFADDPSCFLSV